MTKDNGRSPSGSGSRALHEAAGASSPKASIPNAIAKLRENAEALHSWAESFDEHIRQATDPLFGQGYGLEQRVGDLFAITSRLGVSIYGGLLETASAIEAATAGETGNTDSTEGESATSEAGDAR